MKKEFILKTKDYKEYSDTITKLLQFDLNCIWRDSFQKITPIGSIKALKEVETYLINNKKI